jgi:hypothetical protein
VVYRKEQFEAGTGLPQELIVRDRRYAAADIQYLCENAGFRIIWLRYVKAGKWGAEEAADRAKEILLLCQKVPRTDTQIPLFAST